MAPLWRLGQDRVDTIRHDVQKVLQELPSGFSVGLFSQLNDSKFAGAVNGYEEKELAFGRLHLGDVDVEETDRVALELRTLGLVPAHVR